MSGAQTILALVLVATLVAQALLPSVRIMVVAGGAALSCLLATLIGVSTTKDILTTVPWDVLIILITLGLFSELLVETGLFGVLALISTRKSGANPVRIALLFCIGMYLVSALVNNLTAILLVLPILLILFKLLGVEQRYVSWTLGILLVACNLGGAATPIGDFPAILLLGRGSMSFSSYLVAAAPPTAVALVVLLLIVGIVVRPHRGMVRDPLSTRLTLSVMSALYRKVRVDARLLLPAGLSFAGMLVAWIVVPQSSGIGPDLIAWIGAGVALMVRPRVGEALIRRRVDVEATLFLLSLFVMVGAVSKSGLFAQVAGGLNGLPLPPIGKLVVFLLLAGVLTGLFSAGPSMAALLEVADSLTRTLPKTAVYVGLALSVCAGSSFLLTAATSGPMTQILTERADIRDAEGNPIRFGFFHFLPIGVLSFAVIQSVAIVFGLLAVAFDF
jgi:Na+/H+ antiporter NhaD/arsenite permease-like protein